MDIFQSEIFANMSYIVASMLFIFGLKQLGSPETAQRGNLISASGMFLAVLVTLINSQIISYEWLAAGLILGVIVGASAASLVKMTSMPELVALFNMFRWRCLDHFSRNCSCIFCNSKRCWGLFGNK